MSALVTPMANSLEVKGQYNLHIKKVYLEKYQSEAF